MRIPSLLRRTEPAPAAADDGKTGAVATDTHADERSDVEGRADDSTTPRTAADGAAGRAATDRDGTTDPDGTDRGITDRDGITDPDGSDRGITDRDGTIDPDGSDRGITDRDGTADGDRVGDGAVERDGRVDDDRTPDGAAGRDVPPAPVGPRPRASLLATLGLIVAVGGVLFVLTGALAGYGIAVGAVGAVLAVLGLMATRRRHIAGKSDALLGIALGLGAVVLGVLAMTGQYDWPTTDGDQVIRLREWLDSQFVDRL